MKGHPATWGYYVGDEATPEQLPRIAALRAELKQLDPAHRHLVDVVSERAACGGGAGKR